MRIPVLLIYDEKFIMKNLHVQGMPKHVGIIRGIQMYFWCNIKMIEIQKVRPDTKFDHWTWTFFECIWFLGPAGTGKTESVKALGHQLGRFVLVFNCDETFDFQVI